MLKPDKYLDPRYSVINVTGLMIKILKKNGILTLNELLAALTDQLDPKIKETYLASLSFLFALGKVHYHQKLDAIELIDSLSK